MKGVYRRSNGDEAVLSLPSNYTWPESFLTFDGRRPAKFVYVGDGKCDARIAHGPGHQSQTRCEALGTHDVHYVSNLGEFMEYVEWRDKDIDEKAGVAFGGRLA